MTWVKLDDHFDEHPKFAAVGPLGIAMFVCALAYCNRNLTDGFVPRAIVRTLVDWTVPDADGTPWSIGITAEDHGDALGGPGYDIDGELVAKVLLEHGLFEKAPGGYRIHDYGDFQPSKERVLAERKAASDRMKKVRESRRSPEHGANTERSSGEVRDVFAGSSPNPVPVPEPEPEQSRRAKTKTAEQSVSVVRPAALPNKESLEELGQRLEAGEGVNGRAAYGSVDSVFEVIDKPAANTRRELEKWLAELPAQLVEHVREQVLACEPRKSKAAYAVGTAQRLARERGAA